MRKTVLKYGLISGAISAVLLLLTVPFFEELVRSGNGALVGYGGMLLAALLVFFGVRSYREQNGGRISFGRALGVGALIVAVSAVCYTLTWEAVYFGGGPAFREKVALCLVEHSPGQKPSSAGDPQAAAKAAEQAAEFRKMYDNPAINSAMTFAEPLPVGLIVAAISAAVLRRKDGGPQ